MSNFSFLDGVILTIPGGWVGCGGYVVGGMVAEAMWWVAGSNENKTKHSLSLVLAELGNIEPWL